MATGASRLSLAPAITVTSENQQQPSDPAPPSFSAGDHEMRDYYAAQAASRPPPQQEPYLTPYLGRDARLSQIWSAVSLVANMRAR